MAQQFFQRRNADVILRGVNGVFDVIVIGGGAAGAAAALSAARAGARTALVSARPGATALCGGAWRGTLPTDLADSLAEVGYHVVPVRTPLPWADGSRRLFDECHTVHAADTSLPTLVCGIAGLPAFPAAVLADCWRGTFASDVSATTINLPDTPLAGWAPASLARFIERNTDVFCDLLKPHLRDATATVLLPAILGVSQAEQTRHAIESRLGVRVFEVGGGTPSLPGWRLLHALEAAVSRAGVVVHKTAVTGCAKQGKRVTALTTADAESGTSRLVAKSFVLATGKFLGGGIVANGTFREPVFDLPVWVEHLGERFDNVEPLALTSAERTARQAILFAGVATDDAGRPLNASEAIVFDNVFAAGVVRADTDGSVMNLGTVATDGWAAGARAAA